jgi:hypothetical protein
MVMNKTVPIKPETLKGFADEARRMGKVEGELTTEQMQEIFERVETVIEPLEVTENGTYNAPEGVHGYSPVNVNVPIPDGYIVPTGTIDVTENGTVDVTQYASAVVNVPKGGGAGGGSSELPPAGDGNFGRAATITGMAFYNGVKLPEIPADILEKYPYVWIRKNSNKVDYDLLAASNPWGVNSAIMWTSSRNAHVYYKATSADIEWRYLATYTDTGEYPLGNGILWNNNDILDYSMSYPSLHLKGSECELEIVLGGYAEVAENYNISGESLNEIAEIIQGKMAIDHLLTVEEIKSILSEADFD